jgi:hypothetical protein
LVAITGAGGLAEVAFSRAAVSLANGLAELIPFALGIGAALAVRRAATGLVEVISRWTTDVTALTTSTLATLAEPQCRRQS